MTIKYLLDTNVIYEPLRPKPDESVLGKLRRHQNEMGIASIVWHELLYGCYRLPKSKRRSAIETYLFEIVGPSIPILPYDERAAHWHALQRARLSSNGKTPPFADGQIAAIAAVDDLILITFNTPDYEHFQGIQVKDWRD
jgi:tRNA(fMet)-specific endonuclease VapC